MALIKDCTLDSDNGCGTTRIPLVQVATNSGMYDSIDLSCMFLRCKKVLR